MINIACGQALFRPFFQANEARSGRGARDTCVCAFPRCACLTLFNRFALAFARQFCRLQLTLPLNTKTNGASKQAWFQSEVKPSQHKPVSMTSYKTGIIHLVVLLPYRRSCDDIQECILFKNWTYFCSVVPFLLNKKNGKISCEDA